MLAGRAEPAPRGLVPRWSSRQRPAGVAPPDMKIHLEKNLEEERQILLQQQKLCRSRARRYFLESNRRKKAFEEKRKEQEEREYQIREQILQQRKQKFEEVTEKFQRAHIPLSQRRRAVFHRSVPPLEEALKQIQDSSLKSEVNRPSSHQPAVYWRAVDKALPSSLLKDDHTRQMPRVPDFSPGKETKENRRGGGATKKHAFQLKLEEAQKLLEDQHLSSLQKFCHEVNQITNSETLSSVDSLEAGAPEEPYFLLDKERSASAALQPAQPPCSPDKLPSSKAQRINNWLISLDAPSAQDDAPFSALSSQPTARPSEESVGSKGPPNPTLLRAVERTADPAGSPVGSSRAHGPDPRKSASETSTLRIAFKLERPLVTQNLTLPLRKAWTPTDSPPREAAVPSEPKQENRAPSLAPAAVPLGLPPRTQSARTLPRQSGLAEGINTGQGAFKLGEWEDADQEKKYSHCCGPESPLLADVLQAAGVAHSPGPAAAQETAGALPSGVISNYDWMGPYRKAKYSIHERSGMRFLKSILKKESKYEHDCFKALVLRQGFKLGSKKAAAIRDSIELTKEKGERVDIPKAVKKLRWFDETRDAENDVDGSDPLKNRLDFTQACSRPFCAEAVSEAAANTVCAPACAVGSAERQTPRDESVSENVTRVEGFGTDQVSLKGFIPLGYNFAKESWLGPEEEGSQSPAQKAGPGSQKMGLQRGAAKVARRARYAKAQSGNVHTSRKGSGVRPQSASKAKTFLQAQSQLSIPHPPHPPPQPPSNVRSGKASQASPCPATVPEGPQSMVARNGSHSKHLLPAEQELSQWSQRSGLPFPSICSELAAGLPSPPCCSNCQTLATRNPLSGTQKAAQGDETFCHTDRCHDDEENQTAHKWKRQQDSLGQNEKAAESTAARRKRITANKRGILLEQKRQNPGAAVQRFRGQRVGQTIQLISSEQKQTARGTSVEQVSESTSEFLMAEDLVKASVAEEEILSALRSGQERKPAPSSQEARQFNLCTLSAEEQEILWSLEHLNERLHYLQEIIYKNPSIKNTFKIIPTLDSRPQASVSPDGGSRPRREY